MFHVKHWANKRQAQDLPLQLNPEGLLHKISPMSSVENHQSKIGVRANPTLTEEEGQDISCPYILGDSPSRPYKTEFSLLSSAVKKGGRVTCSLLS